MKKINVLFYTTIALTLTNFLMRTVGVWFNVYLSGYIGSVGIGIFQLILTVYAMSKTLACGGMSLAATRLSIERKDALYSVMNRILSVAATVGIGTALLLYFLSGPISRYWIMSDQGKTPLKILSFSLPAISLSAALNGYMTGIRKMNRYSLIQFAEQIVKIILTVSLFRNLSPLRNETALAAVSFAITASEYFSLGLSALFYRREKRASLKKHDVKFSFFKPFLRIALPDALGANIRSLLNTVEHLLIPIGIRKSGRSVEKAFSDYGTVHGMSLPVLLYPSAVLGVMSGLLVPEIAECKRGGNRTEINYIINRVLRMTTIFSVFVASAMYIFADSISVAVYNSDSATHFIRLLAPLIPIMYLDMATDGMLKGLDLQLQIMKINIIDSLLCVILVAILVPKFAVDGYLVTIYIAEIINFILSFHLLEKKAKLLLSVGKSIIMPMLVSVGALELTRKLSIIEGKPTQTLILSIGAGLVFYLVILRLIGSITKEEAGWFCRIIRPEKNQTPRDKDDSKRLRSFFAKTNVT